MSGNQESAGIFRFKGNEAVITGITQSALGLLDVAHDFDKGLATEIYKSYANLQKVTVSQPIDTQGHDVSEFMTKEIQKLPKLPGSQISKS